MEVHQYGGVATVKRYLPMVESMHQVGSHLELGRAVAYHMAIREVGILAP